MLKKYKLNIIISSAIILLPMLFGIIMWRSLPDTMATHFGISGEADGFSGKTFVVFGFPVILLIVHFVCLLCTPLDKKQMEQSPKALGIIFWIIPTISVFTNGIMYRAAFGMDFDLTLLISVLLGVMFIFMGNYLPKIKQNRTLGIKIYWTIHNEENWNKTHRLGGKLWVACGFIVMLSAFLPFKFAIWIMLCALLAAIIIPIIYSNFIYKQHKKQGITYNASPKSRGEKAFAATGIIIGIVVLIGILIIMFTGNISVTCEDNSFKINATYYTDIEVNYSEIDSIEYRKDLDVGLKANGFNSARLRLGIYKNDEFGSYTVYAYTGAKEYVVLTSGDKKLVLGMRTSEETQAVYNTISEKTGKK